MLVQRKLDWFPQKNRWWIWILALPHAKMSTLTWRIHPVKVVDGSAFLAFGFTSTRVVLQTNSGLHEGTHKSNTKLHWTKSKVLKITSTSIPFMQCILCIFVHAKPFMCNWLNNMLAKHLLMKRITEHQQLYPKMIVNHGKRELGTCFSHSKKSF